MRPLFRSCMLCAALFCLTPTLRAEGAPTPAPAPAPTPIPVSTIVAEADKTAVALTEMQAAAGSDELFENLSKFLPRLKADIDADSTRTAALLAGPAKLSAVQEQIGRWNLLRDNAGFSAGILNEKLGRLDHQSTQLEAMKTVWTATQATALAASVPQDILVRIRGILQQVTATEAVIEGKRTQLLKLQARLSDQTVRITQTLTALSRARGEAVNRMFVRDHPPLWRALATRSEKPVEGTPGLAEQIRDCLAYLRAERGAVALHIIGWALLAAAFVRARRSVRKWTEDDPALRASTAIFDVPIATATVIALWAAFVLYAAGPPLLATLLGAALVFPLMVVLRRIVDPPLLPVTWALLAFYLAAQAREAATPWPVLARCIALAEALGGMLFVVWLASTSRFARKPEKGRRILWRVVGLSARLAFFVFAFVAVTNIFGYVNLSLFAGGLVLKNALLALLLYAACHILDGLTAFALKVPPLSLLAMVRHHRILLERRAGRVVRFAGGVVWTLLALNSVSLLGDTFEALGQAAAFPLVAGVTVGSLLAFLATVWASFLLSRFVRFLLEEDIYRRVRLKPGLPFAISTLLHYAILLLGFYLAMAALLGDISKFTVLAGAFGVGLAFGLQNIVNNFVSSLIVLFERPVKIGDMIEIGPLQGTVRQIGIRATVIRTPQGSDIIIPNAKLISDPVTNWTLTGQLRLVDLEVVTAAPGVDPVRVIALLEAAAVGLPEVSGAPAPEAVLDRISAAALTFKLRVWTANPSGIGRLRSSLTVACNEALSREGIAWA